MSQAKDGRSRQRGRPEEIERMAAIVTMKVTIPKTPEHGGWEGNLVTVTILDTCPVCGERRGDVFKGFSYDGSRRLEVDRWENPCGHIDKYTAVVKEAANNALN